MKGKAHMTISCDCHVTHILEDLSCALCSLDEGHVVVKGEFLGGVKDTPPLLSQVLRLKLYINIKKKVRLARKCILPLSLPYTSLLYMCM